MPTVKASYEAVMIFSLTAGDEAVAELKEKFRALIEQNAEIGEIDDWGKRKLAYPINDKNEGYYVLVEFKSAPSFPLELERVFGITDGIMRSIVIKHDEKKLAKKKAKAAETAAAAPAEAPADAE